MRFPAAVIALFCVPSLAGAQVYFGSARAIDGDTLELGGQRIRLHGIDAVEAGQTCTRNGQTWACGQEAKAFLAKLVDGQPIECQQVDVDRYGRVVARCSVRRMDLARTVIEAGYAMALPQFSDDYVEAEARMRSHAVGIWAGSFDQPAAYRAAHPQLDRPQVQRFAAPPMRARAQPSQVYFGNCAQAWAAGAAPIYRGQPGYRPEMDGDNDGIACEPFRGRR